MPDQVRFNETMRGWFARDVGLPHEDAERAGRAEASPGMFMLTVVTPDVDAMVADPRHRNLAFGCVFLPAIHAQPLGVADGHLDLFVDATPDGRVVHMAYGLALRDADGGHWYLRGIKEVVRRRFWPTVPADTVTLFADLYKGDAAEGRPVLRGILREGVVGVIGQGLSFRGDGGWLGLRGLYRFIRFYVGRAARVYLGPRTEPIRPRWAALQ